MAGSASLNISISLEPQEEGGFVALCKES